MIAESITCVNSQAWAKRADRQMAAPCNWILADCSVVVSEVAELSMRVSAFIARRAVKAKVRMAAKAEAT